MSKQNFNLIITFYYYLVLYLKQIQCMFSEIIIFEMTGLSFTSLIDSFSFLSKLVFFSGDKQGF